jgi:hypothetical protein
LLKFRAFFVQIEFCARPKITARNPHFTSAALAFGNSTGADFPGAHPYDFRQTFSKKQKRPFFTLKSSVNSSSKQNPLNRILTSGHLA